MIGRTIRDMSSSLVFSIVLCELFIIPALVLILSSFNYFIRLIKILEARNV